MSKPIPPDQRAKVLAHYEITGNASEAGRRAGVSLRSARRIVGEAIDSGTLADSGRKLRARAIDAVERMLLDAAGVAHERLTGDWCESFDKTDPGPQYCKALSDAHKTLVTAERIISERRGLDEALPAVVLRLEYESPAVEASLAELQERAASPASDQTDRSEQQAPPPPPSDPHSADSE